MKLDAATRKRLRSLIARRVAADKRAERPLMMSRAENDEYAGVWGEYSEVFDDADVVLQLLDALDAACEMREVWFRRNECVEGPQENCPACVPVRKFDAALKESETSDKGESKC